MGKRSSRHLCSRLRHNANPTRVLGAVLALAVACVFGFPAAAAPPHYRSPAYTNRLIVKLKPQALAPSATGVTVDTLQGLSASAGVALRRVRSTSDGRQVLELPNRLTDAAVQDIAARLSSDPAVDYAEPDRMVYPSAVPNDPYYGLQWNLKGPGDGEAGGVDLPAAWDITVGDPAIVIAVVDTGVLPHQDLAGRLLPGYDFISDARTANDGDGRDADASDPGDWITADENAGTDATGGYYAGCAVTDSTWHGTHVAGMLAAVTDNNIGVAGINWRSKLLPVRVLGKCGGYTSDIIDAIRWAAGLSVSGVPDNSNPAQVINLSLSGPGPCGQSEQQAISDAIAAGATVVVAAGNNDADSADYHPGDCAGVVTVAAGTRAGGRASYSNFGTNVKITAPGGDTSAIFSTLDRGTRGPLDDNTYAYYIGTSMAAAHVTGTVSLMLSANYALTHSVLSPGEVLKKLQATARPFPTGTGGDCTTAACGPGLLDAVAAVRAVSTPPAADAGPDRFATTGTTVALDGGGSADPDGAPLVFAWTQTSGTPVVLNNANTAAPTFTAPAVSGALAFDLTVTNDVGLEARDSVTVTVAAPAPVASDQHITLDEGTQYVGDLSAGGNGTGLIYHLVDNGIRGTAVITDAATGQFTYTPYLNTSGQDSFTFQVNNGAAASNVATVSVDINPVNQPPLAVDTAFTTAPDSPYDGRLVAGDVDGNALTYAIVKQPDNGTVTLTDDSGHFSYAPAGGAAGSDAFTYQVTDGGGGSRTASVDVHIVAVGGSPRLVNHGINGLVLSNGTTVQALFGVDDPGAADSAGDVFSVSAPQLGTAAFSGATLTYTASTPGFELLSVAVRDGRGDIDAMILPVTVNPAAAVDANHDGLGDAQAVPIGLDADAADGDTDGDGVADVFEVGRPDHPTDSDGDNVIDALEPGAAAEDASRLQFTVSAPAAARLGLPGLARQALSVAVDGGATLRAWNNPGTGIPLYSKDALAGGDTNYNYPYGLLDYSVHTSASSVHVTITLPDPNPLPAAAVVRKMDVTGAWRTVDGALIDSQRDTVTLTLTDNDEFDLDPVVGVIRDPVGVAVPSLTTTGSQLSGHAPAPGGGGALSPLILAAGLGAAWRRRRRSAVPVRRR